MRVALLGDFDTYLFRGLARPQNSGQIRLSPGMNLARGFQELGRKDLHYVVCTPEVQQPAVDDGPFGRLHRLPCPRFSGSPSFFFWRRRIILSELAKIQPDIVHGQGTECEYAFTAVTAPYPHVITFHGIMHRVHEISPPPLFSLSHVPRWTEKLVARKARHVISISQEVETFLQKHHSRARTYRIPNAMAPCFFEVQPQRRDVTAYTLLYVGAVQPRKGLLDLVKALAAAQLQIDRPIRLLVIGPGGNGSEASYGALVRQAARECQVSDRIQWLGTLGERDIATTLAQSDALVLPSFWENMPMCVGEAMAAGVAVISTNVAGTPDWVEDGRTGLLVPPGDVPALAQAIRTLLSDAALRSRLAAAGRAQAAARYTPRTVARETESVYEAICRERK